MLIVRLTLVLLVLLVGVAFHLRNQQTVVIDYYLWSLELPLSAALIFALLCGATLGVLSGLPLWLRLKYQKLRQARAARAGQSPHKA